METTLSEKDHKYIWHPFTQMKHATSIPIIKAEGIYLYSDDGKRYIDGISSWWVNLHGHTHPYIVEKIKSQAEILEHVMFAGFTHIPAVELAERLLKILPRNLSKVFYSDNGSTAVEVAIKMALQYWYNQNIPKTKVICFKHSYHGDTFGAMSAAGKNPFNRPFWSLLFDVEMIDPPIKGKENESINQLQDILKKDNSACFIFEPLVLGAGGMIMYSSEGLNHLMQLCRQHNVLTIADEVMTGFGRTGTLFACDQLTHQPDIICLSKGLTGGFLPLGVTACKEDIYRAFLGNSYHQALLHGHSYTANPLACVSGLASLDLLLSENCSNQRNMISFKHHEFSKKWKTHPKLIRCESFGTILALEYKRDPELIRNKLYKHFIERNILLRPLGNVLYVLPPYCIQNQELETIYSHIIETLEEDF